MMRTGLAITLAASMGRAAEAQEAKALSLRTFMENPRSYVGTDVRLPGIGCVDNPKGGFTCVTQVGGQMLRINASGLGAKTALPIAERLIGDCKGTANLTRATCRVDIEIKPNNVARDTLETERGSMPILVVYSGMVEMFTPKR